MEMLNVSLETIIALSTQPAAQHWGDEGKMVTLVEPCDEEEIN